MIRNLKILQQIIVFSICKTRRSEESMSLVREKHDKQRQLFGQETWLDLSLLNHITQIHCVGKVVTNVGGGVLKKSLTAAGEHSWKCGSCGSGHTRVMSRDLIKHGVKVTQFE